MPLVSGFSGPLRTLFSWAPMENWSPPRGRPKLWPFPCPTGTWTPILGARDPRPQRASCSDAPQAQAAPSGTACVPRRCARRPAP